MVRTYNHPTSTFSLSDGRGFSARKKPQSQDVPAVPPKPKTPSLPVDEGISVMSPSKIPSTTLLGPSPIVPGFPTLNSMPTYQSFMPPSMILPTFNPYGYPPMAHFQTPVQLQYDQLLQLKRLEEEKYRQNLSASHIYPTEQSIPLKPYRFLGDLQNFSPIVADSTSIRSNSAPTTDLDKLTRELQVLQQLKQENQHPSADQQRPTTNHSEITKLTRKKSTHVEELPPWLRGNPQPTTGVRGAPNWLQSQNNLTTVPSTAPDLRREKSLPLNFSFGKSAAIAAEIQRLNNEHLNASRQEISSAESKALQKQMEQIIAQQQKQKDLTEPSFFDNFGKGGGGAPMRDTTGKPITDRRILRMSWNGGSLGDILAAQAANNKTLNDSINGRFQPDSIEKFVGLTESNRALSQPSLPIMTKSKDDEYKEELKRQIEEKRKQKELENERQKQEDERDRLRIEKELQRIAQEEAEERTKQLEKAKMAERKQAELDLAYKQAAETAKQLKETSSNSKLKKNIVKPPTTRSPTAESQHLEWWEKKPDYNAPSGSDSSAPQARNHSPQILLVSHKNDPVVEPQGRNKHTTKVTPSSRKPPPTAASSVVTYQSTKRRTKSPTMSIATTEAGSDNNNIEENEALLHQISAMRQRLQKEQIRVQNAIRRQELSKHKRSAKDDEELDTDDADTIRSIPVIKAQTSRRATQKSRGDLARQSTNQSITSGLSAAERIIQSRKVQHSAKLRPSLSQSSLSIDKENSTVRRSRLSNRNHSIGDIRDSDFDYVVV